MQKPPEDDVLRVLREEFDGSAEGVARSVRKIGKVLRASLVLPADSRQIEMFEVINERQ